jgi:hypothetical protein
LHRRQSVPRFIPIRKISAPPRTAVKEIVAARVRLHGACGVLLLSTILTRKLGLAAKPLFEFGYPRHVGFGFDTRIDLKQIIHCAGTGPIYESWDAFFAADRELMAAGRLSLFDQKKLGAVYRTCKLVFWFHYFFLYYWA